jgi:hypothetical protein
MSYNIGLDADASLSVSFVQLRGKKLRKGLRRDGTSRDQMFYTLDEISDTRVTCPYGINRAAISSQSR